MKRQSNATRLFGLERCRQLGGSPTGNLVEHLSDRFDLGAVRHLET
jgi:hypothetical protein